MEITAIDIAMIVKEMKKIVGGIVRKVYFWKIEKNYILNIEIYSKNTGNISIICTKNVVFISKNSIRINKSVDNFCHLLRKKIKGKRIVEIKQIDFERIVCIDFGETKIFLEIFHNGNIIVCNDNNKIIHAFYYEEWKDRSIRKGIVYSVPGNRYNIFKLSSDDVYEYLKESKKKLFSFLAIQLNLGKKYTEILLNNLCICKTMFNKKDIERLIETVKKMLNSTTFCVCDDEIFVCNINGCEVFDNINEAIEYVFFKNFTFEEQQKKKLERILEKNKRILKDMEKKEKIMREAAQTIFKRYSEILSIINSIKNDNIEKAKKYKMFKRYEKKEKRVVLNICGIDVYIFLEKGIEASVGYIYNKAKKIAKKIEGIKRSIENIEKKMNSEKEKETRFILKDFRSRDFRIFKTLNGFKVICGKNTESNEKLIRRYVKDNDLVFHANIHGSAFVVLKNGMEAENRDREEAARIAACYSSAWKKKLCNIDVYSVIKDNIDKIAHGEYIGRGAYIIRKKYEWYKNVELYLLLLVDIKKKIMQIQFNNIKTRDIVFKIIPGEMNVSETCKKINDYFKRIGVKMSIEVSQIERIIPYGKCDVKLL